MLACGYDFVEISGNRHLLIAKVANPGPLLAHRFSQRLQQLGQWDFDSVIRSLDLVEGNTTSIMRTVIDSQLAFSCHRIVRSAMFSGLFGGDAVKKTGLTPSKWEFCLELFDGGEVPIPIFLPVYLQATVSGHGKVRIGE